MSSTKTLGFRDSASEQGREDDQGTVMHTVESLTELDLATDSDRSMTSQNEHHRPPGGKTEGELEETLPAVNVLFSTNPSQRRDYARESKEHGSCSGLGDEDENNTPEQSNEDHFYTKKKRPASKELGNTSSNERFTLIDVSNNVNGVVQTNSAAALAALGDPLIVKNHTVLPDSTNS